jgi:hypothetical protein
MLYDVLEVTLTDDPDVLTLLDKVFRLAVLCALFTQD